MLESNSGRLVRFLTVVASAIVLSHPSAVQAYNFRIDDFQIIKNGSTLFDDSFTDGNPPPSAPNFSSGASASYVLNSGATVGPEIGGKLTLDSSGAALAFNFNESRLFLTQRATLLTSQTGGATGLNSNSTFVVTGTFDLILPGPIVVPGVNGDQYAVRLTDGTSTVEGNDILTMQVVRRSDGQLAIQFRHFDDAGNTNTLLAQTLLNPAHDQIALRLSHPDASNSTIFGSFAYIDGGVLGSFTTFGTTFDIFNGESFTRAGFEAATPTLATPEPSSVVLLSCGLIALVGFFARGSRQ